jgi:hypothetical protein
VANEGGSFTASGLVRYGYGTSWITKTINGTATCGSSTFNGSDPAPGLSKLCQMQISAKNVVQTGGMPVINTALMQPPMKGFGFERVQQIGGNGGAAGLDTGAFRTTCGFSHFAFDDPIVLPGQPGKSHLHNFWGNSDTNGNSTVQSIASTGDSTCAGGTMNRTGYWTPAMVNLKNGAPIVPYTQIFYYKAGYLGVKPADVKPFPAGLRMVAGNSAGKTPIPNGDVARIICSADGAIQGAIPNCAIGSTIELMVIFPQCWDGVNLDSPDHKSHMAYATGSGCPSTHPVGLPEITMNVLYLVTEDRPDLNWKLASDNYVGQGGYSLHADWFGGWKTEAMTTFVKNCINPAKSTSNDLCDGRMLY